MNKFYIIRHGQTDWNVLGKTQGHGNSELTKEGIAQAKSVSCELRDIDLIFSSDLKRAEETAKIISNEINKEIIIDTRLREMNFGKWEGKLISEIKKEYEKTYNTWRNYPSEAQIESGENLHIIKDRVEEFFDEINKKYQNKNILIVSHSITVRVMLLTLLGSGVENIYRIKQDNTAINIVEFKIYGPVVIKLNDTNHLLNKNNNIGSALE